MGEYTPAQCAPSRTLEFWFSRQCATNATPMARAYGCRRACPRVWRVARSAVVTGSSSGIGRAIAVRLAADGFWVLLADVRRDPLTGGEPTDDLVRGSGGAGALARADAASRPECDRRAARAVAATGHPDVGGDNDDVAARHSTAMP